MRRPDPAPATGETVATSAVDAAARLAETEARLRSLVEALPAAVYLDRYRRDDGTFIAVEAPEWFVRNRSGRGALVPRADLTDAASA